jgi:hypothetical protein
MLVTPALGRHRKKDHEFKASLSYILDPVSKKKEEKNMVCFNVGCVQWSREPWKYVSGIY